MERALSRTEYTTAEMSTFTNTKIGGDGNNKKILQQATNQRESWNEQQLIYSSRIYSKQVWGNAL